MLLVLAGEYDRRGPLLCERWASAGARLLTPSDLQRPGWRHEPARPVSGTAIAAGEPLAVAAITGVCSLMPCVLDSDLPSIRAEDRTYVAAEMTAFLCAWLSSLACPVFNRPTPSCLCGPPWGPERWLHAAVRAGLPTVQAAPRESTAVTVVAAGVFGATSPAQHELAARMSEFTGVPLLRVLFSGPESSPAVAGADLWLDTDRPGVAEAIGVLLSGQR
jgi:hypothetical protein